MNTGYTHQAFDKELAELRAGIDEMGRLAERQLAQALKAMLANDSTAASAAIAWDADMDRLDGQVEALAVALLARRQPVGPDLREIVAALRISSNYERIGDFAAAIARRAVTLGAMPVTAPRVPSLAWMGENVQSMLHDVITAYAAHDAALAESVRNRDSAVDHAHTALFREMLTYMMETPQQISGCLHLLFAAKAIERVGDHATNVAENICFLVKGKLPSDERPKDDHTSEVM